MIKKYFCKVSWFNNEQPLTRYHENGMLEVDWSTHQDSWALCDLYQSQNFGQTTRRSGFVIDFMLEIPKSDS